MKKLISLVLFALVLTGCLGGNPNIPEDPPEKPKPVLDCTTGMTAYKLEGTTLEFCYDPAWGDVVVTDEAGTVETSTTIITFSGNAVDLRLFYEPLNYSPVEGGTGLADVEHLNFITPEEIIAADLAEFLDLTVEDITVRKTDIALTRAARVDMGNEIRYYIPNAVEGYNIMFQAGSDYAIEIDEFAFDLVF